MSFQEVVGSRKAAQQKLIDELFAQLRQESHEFGHECADALLGEFHVGVFTYLMTGVPRFVLFPDLQHQSVVERVLQVVLTRVDYFANDEAEYRQILCKLDLRLYLEAVSKQAQHHVLWEIDPVKKEVSA